MLRGWEKVLVEGVGPSARYLHSSVVWRNILVSFGGFNGSSLSDTSFLDLANRRWMDFKTTGTTPLSRHDHSACVWNNKMIVFGGDRGHAGQMLNDTFALDLESQKWEELKTTGERPSPRWGHSAVVIGSTMIVFGGYCAGYHDDLYCLNLESLEWTQPKVEGVPPRRCGAHRALAVENRMYVGPKYLGSTKYDSELSCFDFEKMRWEKVDVVGNGPSARSNYGFSVMHPSKLVLHGGWDGFCTSLGDVWVFDIESSKWERIVVEKEVYRRSHSLGYFEDKIVLLGGSGMSSARRLTGGP